MVGLGTAAEERHGHRMERLQCDKGMSRLACFVKALAAVCVNKALCHFSRDTERKQAELAGISAFRKHG